MTRAQIVSEARRWIGTRYRHKGRSATGLDCVGLLVVVARALGVPHDDDQHYIDWPDPQRRLIAVLDCYMDVASPLSAWPGSIGLFTQDRLPGHCGIFATAHGAPHVIHAHIRRRGVVEEPYPTGEMRLVRRYQLRGVEG